jgi:hypothetical protein
MPENELLTARTGLTDSERRMRAQIAADTSWANTPDRTARTEHGRRAMQEKFERQVDPDGTLPPAERAKRAANARRAFMRQLAFKSAKARRLRAQRGGAA